MQIWKVVRLLVGGVLLCAACGAVASADQWDKKTVVTFGDSVEIPGQVLPPGTYVFKLMNSQSNRNIVQIWTEDESQIIATIITVPEYRLEPADHTVFEFEERPADSPMALHSWFYPGDALGLQFIYR
jgi:hypothetical protein